MHKEAFHMESEKILEARPLNNYVNLLNESMIKEGSIARDTNNKIMNFTSRKSQKVSLWENSLSFNDQNQSLKIT